MDRKKARTLEEQGNQSFRSGQYEKALELYRLATVEDPTWSMTWFKLGSALQRLRQPEEAIEAHSKAIQLDHPDPGPYHGRAFCFVLLGEHEKALADFTHIIESAPDKVAEAVGLNGRGHVLGLIGRHDRAIEDFRRALGINPQYAAARGNLAGSLLAVGQPEEALRELNEAQRGRRDLNLHSIEGAIYLALNKPDRAITVFRKGFRRDPDNARNPYNLAVLYAGRGDSRWAARWLRRALDIDSSLVDNARTEPAFDSIRDSEHFRDLGL